MPSESFFWPIFWLALVVYGTIAAIVSLAS